MLSCFQKNAFVQFFGVLESKRLLVANLKFFSYKLIFQGKMPVPNEIRAAEEGTTLNVRTKLPLCSEEIRTASLDNAWVTLSATRGQKLWHFRLKTGDVVVEESVADEDETKSLMEENLWNAGWFQLEENANSVSLESNVSGMSECAGVQNITSPGKMIHDDQFPESD
jgi:hypothetical protein